MKHLILSTMTILLTLVLWSCKAKQNAVHQYETLSLHSQHSSNSISLQCLQLFDTIDIFRWPTEYTDTNSQIRYRAIRHAKLTDKKIDSIATAIVSEQEHNNDTTSTKQSDKDSNQMIRLVLGYIAFLVVVWVLACKTLRNI